jgi:hypothetical protein
MKFFAPANVERRVMIMDMKRPLLALLLLATVALSACQTTHRAAVSTFRVIDAPHQYIRRALSVDENDNPQTTTTTTSTETYAAPNTATYPQPYRQQVAPPPPPPQYSSQHTVVTTQPPPVHREVVTNQRERESAPPTPTPAPRVTSRSSTTTSNSTTTGETTTPQTTTSTTHTSATEKTDLPYAKPVPGKAGYVFSPYDKNGGYVDVTGFAPGSKVKDPYSGKIFRVP